MAVIDPSDPNYPRYYGTPVPAGPTGIPPSGPGSHGPVGETDPGTTPPAGGGYQTPAGQIKIGTDYTPDYAALLKSDPGYLQAVGDAAYAQRIGADARASALRTALINYGGGLPGSFADRYGDIRSSDLALAQGNQFSTLAQLARALVSGQRNLRGQLAARGMLESGDYGYGLDQLDVANAQQRSDAATAFGNLANQAYGAYTGVLNQNRDTLRSAIQQAYSNAIANPNYRPTTSHMADYDAAASHGYGSPVYSWTDEAGQLHHYDANGKEITV